MKARHILLAFLVVLLAVAGSNAWADYFRPAYLQLTEHPGGIYDVRWKTPAQSESVIMSIRPVFPTGSDMIQPLVSTYAIGSAVMVGKAKIPGGLEGKTIRFDGLADTGNQVLVRFIRMDGSEDLYKVAPTKPELTIPKDPDPVSVSARYMQLGIAHIWLGFDHLLFITGLFMLVANLRTLFWTITSFTLAHSITLALVTLNVIQVPVPPVEAFIALSIVFVAVEVERQARGHSTLASRKPWLIAFTFGLLHGMGFASALAQIGLPRHNIPLALLFFNVGVEIGQIMFVAALLVILNIVRRLARPAQLSAGRLAACYGIGGMASYWLFVRISNFI